MPVGDHLQYYILKSGLGQTIEDASLLMKTPSKMNRRDVATMKAQGFSNTAIHDAGQVVGYFNCINPVADSSGGIPSLLIAITGIH